MSQSSVSMSCQTFLFSFRNTCISKNVVQLLWRPADRIPHSEKNSSQYLCLWAGDEIRSSQNRSIFRSGFLMPIIQWVATDVSSWISVKYWPFLLFQSDVMTGIWVAIVSCYQKAASMLLRAFPVICVCLSFFLSFFFVFISSKCHDFDFYIVLVFAIGIVIVLYSL